MEAKQVAKEEARKKKNLTKKVAEGLDVRKATN